MTDTITRKTIQLGEQPGIFARLYPVFRAGKITSLVIAGYFVVQGARIAYSWSIDTIEQVKHRAVIYLIADTLQHEIEAGIDKQGNLILKRGNDLTADELRRALAFNLNKKAIVESALKDVGRYVGEHVLDTNLESNE